MAVKGQGQAISCTTEPRICEGPTRKWGMILRGQEEGLGEHRDESTSFVEHVFFVIFLVIVCGDLFGYFVLFRYREMKGRYVRIFCRGREVLRGREGYTMAGRIWFSIFEKISGFEWIWNNNNNNDDDKNELWNEMCDIKLNGRCWQKVDNIEELSHLFYGYLHSPGRIILLILRLILVNFKCK